MPAMAPPHTRMERYIALMGGEENLPKQQYKAALTDAEMAARAPDSTISPHGPIDPQSYDIFNGDPYVNNDLQIVDESDDEPEPHPAPKKQASRQPTQITPIQPAQLQSDDSPLTLDANLGELSAPELCFIPIIAFSRFPYKLLPSDLHHASEDIADAFFNAGKFWTRTWDV